MIILSPISKQNRLQLLCFMFLSVRCFKFKWIVSQSFVSVLTLKMCPCVLVLLFVNLPFHVTSFRYKFLNFLFTLFLLFLLYVKITTLLPLVCWYLPWSMPKFLLLVCQYSHAVILIGIFSVLIYFSFPLFFPHWLVQFSCIFGLYFFDILFSTSICHSFTSSDLVAENVTGARACTHTHRSIRYSSRRMWWIPNNLLYIWIS